MKITKYFLSFAAALGMMTGCYKPEIVQMVAPEDVVPPVLESIDDMVYTLDNIGKDSLVFNWAPVEYGADVQIDYALEVCLPGEKKINVASGLTQTTHTGYYENLNTVIRYQLGVEPEEATELEFYVSAKFLDYEKVYSAPVKATVTTVDAPTPVLGAIEDIEITLENIEEGKTPMSWETIVYGKRTAVTYSIEVALPDATDVEDRSVVVSGLKKDKADVAYKELNATLLYGLEIEPNKKTDVNFYVAASIGGVGKVYSEPVLATVEVTNSEKEYPKLYIVGSYNGWNHDNAANPNQFIFDFAEEDKVYQGLIDFGADHSANEFKITAGGWGNQEHSKASGAAEGLTTLVAGGGDNINTYQAKRYYHLTFDRTDASNITLNADFSFDHVGVVGSFNGWSEVNNVEMTFHAGKQRFYADVEFTEDAEFKFNMDKTWEVSYGAGSDGNLTSNNGANIKAAAGNYRIYLNMNNKDKITYELNAAAYGTEEGAGVTPPAEDPEPEEPGLKGWGIVGTITGWANGADIMMASDGKWYVAKGVEFGAEDKFKIRLDGKWETSFGGEFKANEEVVLTSENGPDIVPAAGTYDIYFDPETGKAWFINDGSYPGGEAAPVMSIYGVIGVNGDWDNDIMMYEADGIYVARKVEFTANGSFKVRKAGTWDDTANFGLEGGSGPVEVDHVYDVISAGDSGNLEIAAGTYDIWLDLENLKVYIMTPGKDISEAVSGEVEAPVDPATLEWYLVGQFNSWATSSADFKLTKTEDGKWFEFKGFVADGQGFKFHAAGEDAWAVNRGAASEEEVESVAVTAGEATALAAGGKNMTLAAGTYDVYMNAACDKVYFMPEGEMPEEMVVKYPEYIYVPGNHQKWDPASAPALWSPEKNGVYTGFCYFNGEFKFTHVREWNKGEYNSTNFETYPEGFAAAAEGSTNMSAPDGYYYVTVNVPEKKIEVLPVAWGVIGTSTAGGWEADQDMTWNAEKKCWTATLALTAGELKFRSNDAWDINPNLGGAFDNLTLGGGNINITEAGTYVMDLYTERTSSDKIYCTMTKQ